MQAGVGQAGLESRFAVGGHRPRSALGDGSVPGGLGRPRWLADAGPGIDCRTRQLLGWRLSRSGKAGTAAAAL